MDTGTGISRRHAAREAGEGGDYARGIHTARILASSRLDGGKGVLIRCMVN